MKISRVLVAVTLYFFSAVSLAESAIYETEDSSGTPVFSDTPSPGAEKVELPPGNIADPVAPRPPAEKSDPEPVVETKVTPRERIVIIGDDNDDDYREERLEERREILDAEERREVGNADERRETMDAQPRKKIGQPGIHP